MTLLLRIKDLAQKNGTNIKNLECATGLGNGTIRRWDNSPPSVDKLLKIANILNTSMDYLMTGSEKTESTLTQQDAEWLSLIHQLPHDAQLEFKGEIKGYLKCLEQESNANVALKPAK